MNSVFFFNFRFFFFHLQPAKPVRWLLLPWANTAPTGLLGNEFSVKVVKCLLVKLNILFILHSELLHEMNLGIILVRIFSVHGKHIITISLTFQISKISNHQESPPGTSCPQPRLTVFWERSTTQAMRLSSWKDQGSASKTDLGAWAAWIHTTGWGKRTSVSQI